MSQVSLLSRSIFPFKVNNNPPMTKAGSPSPLPLFGKITSAAESQIKSLWEYEILIDTQALQAIHKEIDIAEGRNATGEFPQDLADAFGSQPDAFYRLMEFAWRQRGLMLLDQEPQRSLTTSTTPSPVQFTLIKSSEDTAAYKVNAGKNDYALTISKEIHSASDNPDTVYAKWRNLFVANLDEVQNVPKLYCAQPEMGWMLTEFMDESKSYNVVERGKILFSDFLKEHNLVHTSPWDNHINGHFVDLGHIVTEERYAQRYESHFGPSEKYHNEIKQIEATYLKSD